MIAAASARCGLIRGRWARYRNAVVVIGSSAGAPSLHGWLSVTGLGSSAIVSSCATAASGTRNARSRGMLPRPSQPQPKEEPKKSEPGVQPLSPVNPDPKAHPIHPPIPVQPIHEGTDPARPVTPGEGSTGT